jgi:hypothetical protein
MSTAPDRRTGPATSGPLERVDEEFAAEHGTTASESSLEEEEHPEINPQSPGELGHKIKEEASAGHGPLDKAKRVLQELDRDISGEYERREDPSAPPAKPDSDR